MKKIFSEVGINKFVRRQIKGSGKTYSKKLSFEEIALHAQEQISNGVYKKGYREGVILANVDKNLINNFVCSLVKIEDNTQLVAKTTKRQEEEEPYIQIRALNGSPLKIDHVDLILYRHDVLSETNENSTKNKWELISFHAIPKYVKKMPMGPITMMRNQLQLKGGTKAHYSSEEWAESVLFWQKYAILKD